MCIAIVSFPGFEINLIFLIRPFFYLTKKSRQNLITVRTKRAFKVKQKAFFIIFKGLSVAKNCLIPERVPLKKVYYEVYIRDAIPPQLYGVIKAHKLEKTYPMRVIVSKLEQYHMAHLNI